MSRPGGEIKVLVVDDSALMRKMIPVILNSDEGIRVVGTAMDGDFALKKIPELKPDVITLDVDMPRMDGLTTLRSIVREFDIPVILVSSLTSDGAETTLRALEIGAFDFVAKPNEAISLHINEVSKALIEKVKAASLSKPRRPFKPVTALPKPKTTPHIAKRARHVVAIGVSTGGPQALAEILPEIPADFPSAVLIVQHMPGGFTELFARRLNEICRVAVKEASDGDLARAGLVLIAPGGKHMRVKKTPLGPMAVISQSPEVDGHRPSATVLFDSVSEEFGPDAVAVLMTGMGDDGVEGMRKIKERGGVTIAQDERTSTIFGMPKVAIERGYADIVLGLEDIVPKVIELSGMSAMRPDSAMRPGPAMRAWNYV